MIVIHAIWAPSALHLWGESAPPETMDGAPDPVRSAEPTDLTRAADLTTLLAVDELRRCLGDVWDSLLVADGQESALSLRLPHRNGKRVASFSQAHAASLKASETLLIESRVPTLMFSPADAFDLLTNLPVFAHENVRYGASVGYWSRVTTMVRELLAHQRFVPAVHRAANGVYRGYWRVVVDDQETSERLRILIKGMPPICRSAAGNEPGPASRLAWQASELVENFLWTLVDALVRRCLEGDELAHALQERGDDSSLEIDWLRSLVCDVAALTGTREGCQSIHTLVHGWLAALEPQERGRASRTCFQLHPPAAGGEPGSGDADRKWKLTLHLQSREDPSLVLDAHHLDKDHGRDPTILPRPFAGGRAQLRTDVAHAAKRFPALSVCAEADGPLQCELTLQEAYRFLRDAAPLLEAEGFGVWLPAWWSADRLRPRMYLDIRPLEGNAPVSQGAMRLDTLIAYDWRVALGDEDLSLEEISRLALSKEPLIQLRGQWAEIQSAELNTALQFLQEHRSSQATVFEALRLSYLADDLETGLPVDGVRTHGWIAKLLQAPEAEGHIEHLPPPAGFQGTLRAYQQRGVEWLAFLSRHGLGACLADDMGLGKTIQLIGLLLHEREAGNAPGPTLLIVPMSLVGNWQREIARFAPSLKVMVHHGLDRVTGPHFANEVNRHDVVIVTYGLTHRDQEQLARVNWHRIALDEAQNIKNPAAKQALAVRSLSAVHRVALTGTPVENRLSELWSIMDFLNRGYLGKASDFRRRFAGPIERSHDTDRAQRLRHLIRPFVLRRLKSDPNILPDLPDKLEMTVFCNLTREQAALYQALMDDMLAQIDRSGGIQRRGLILATLVKLKQICNHPAHFLADGSALSKRSGKCERLTEMLDEVLAEGHRALIFTQFREMGLLLVKHLQECLGHEIPFLHGGTQRSDRDLMVDRFQNGSSPTPLMLLSLKAGGLGLNLTAAQHVFHFDRWWNPAVEDQATDRAHRIGQDKQVSVHKFVCIGTLEERIAALIEEKRNLARNIIGNGDEWVTELSTEALRGLLTLSRDAVADD